MAKFLGKFDIASYEELTDSAEYSARRRTITNKQRTPFQLQRGDQSQGFDIHDVAPPEADQPVIIKLDEQLNYVAMPKANYQAKLERELQVQIDAAGVRRGDPLPASVFTSIQSEISARIAQLPDTILFLAEDTPFTGSYNIKISGSNDFGYSGIAANGGFDRIINCLLYTSPSPRD